MNVKLKFLGAAQTVTGSKHLLEVDDFRVLIDCGMFQGLKELRLRNWNPLPVPADSIDAVVITHAHIDHTGYLPRLYREGFRGTIYCTHPTKSLMEILLRDAGKLQEEEADFAEEKGYSKHAHPQPLYTVKDVERLLPLIESVDFNQTFHLTPNIGVTFQVAGHILGAAFVDITLKGERMTKNIIFSGDLGKYEDILSPPPTAPAHADYMVIESTYGNRTLPDTDTAQDLARIIRQTFHRGGCVVIPAFAVGRTQQLLLLLKQIIQENILPPFPVYVDSPMAIQATDLYRRHLAEFNPVAAATDFFEFKTLHYCPTQQASEQLYHIKKGAVIISASGMATGGRILHHFYHRLRNEQDTIVFAGYQSEGTRGRRILDGEKEIKLLGETIPVACHVEEIKGLSAHADKDDLLRWLRNLPTAPKKVFIVHGEKTSAFGFEQVIKDELQWNTAVPEYLEAFSLFEGM